MSVGAFYGDANPAWAANKPLAIDVRPNGSSFFALTTTLDGRDYTFGFFYCVREDRWYLQILDANNNILAAGIKLIANWALLRRFGHVPGIPPGNLMVDDMGGHGDPPGANDWVTRCRLLYYPATVQP